MDFEMNENLAAEEAAEKVEPTTEESSKVYTEEEFNAKLDEILPKRLARQEAKIRREYERKNAKVNDLLDVLRAGTGRETVDELHDTFTGYYSERGVKIPEKPVYSAKDEARLAQAEAKDIIESGMDAVKDELGRLSDLGEENMSQREKLMFPILFSHHKSEKRKEEFVNLGISREEYESDEFQSFLEDTNPNAPAKNVVNLYRKTIPKKNIKPMGSMTNTAAQDNGVKDFYSYEEASKFTVKDFDKNPKLYEAVKKSMTKW